MHLQKWVVRTRNWKINETIKYVDVCNILTTVSNASTVYWSLAIRSWSKSFILQSCYSASALLLIHYYTYLYLFPYFQAVPPHLHLHFQKEPLNLLSWLLIKVTYWLIIDLNDERVILKNEKAFSGILVFIKRQLINEIAYFDFSAPVEQKLEVIPGVAPAVNLNVIGMSSEWFGNSNHGATTFQNERKSFERSKVRKNSLEFSFPAKFPVPYISYECLY